MKEKLERIRELLIIVDMLNGFVKTGTLADQKVGRIIPEQVRLAREFLKEIKVFYL